MRIMCFWMTSILIGSVHAQNFDYGMAWKTVESSLEKGLTDSALKQAKEIYEFADKDNNEVQFTKALVYIASIEHNYGEDVVLPVQDLFLKSIEKSASPYKEIIHAYYGLYLNKYLLENKYEIASRTNTEDIRQINLMSEKQLKNVIENNFERSLNGSLTRELRITDVKDILQEFNEEGAILTPTVYHVLAGLYISYLQMSIGDNLTDHDSLFIMPFDEFMNHKWNAEDSSPALKLARIYHNLQILNKAKEYAEATAKTELERLSNHFRFSSSTAEFQLRLKEGISQFRKQRYVTRYFALLAQEAMKSENGNNLVDAERLCREAIALFPESEGANSCNKLLNEINQKSIRIQTESVVTTKQDLPVFITTTNLDTVFLRLVRMPDYYIVAGHRDNYIELLTKLKAEKTLWQTTLSIMDKDDHRPVATSLTVEKQKMGSYLLIASNVADFSSAFSVTGFQVSNLAYIRGQGNKSDFFLVVDRESGKPLKGVKATFFTYSYEHGMGGKRMEIGKGISDKDGKLSKPAGIADCDITLVKGKDVFDGGIYHYFDVNSNDAQTQRKVLFFVDRPVYRPGQKLLFKLLSLSYSSANIPSVLTNDKTTVSLLDVNGQTVLKKEFITNEWGTASGDFAIPAGRLNGYYQLVAENSSKSVRVEEYKRPRFEVKMDTLSRAVALNDSIEVSGNAVYYSGLPVQNAEVKFSVSRREVVPFYCRWYPGWFNQSPVIIASGKLKTDSKGYFTFSYVADAGNNQKKKPEYIFETSVEVISEDGETQQTHQSLSLWSEPYKIETAITGKADRSADMKGSVKVRNTADLLIVAAVSLNVYQLNGSDVFKRMPYWNEELAARDNGGKILPPGYGGWKVGNLLHTLNFSSAEYFDFSFLNSGVYLFEINVEGNTPVSEVVVVTDANANQWPPLHPVMHYLEQKDYAAGDLLHIKLGAPFTKQMTYVTLMRGNSVIYAKWVSVNHNTSIEYRITEEDKGGLHLSYAYIKNNRFFNHSEDIRVPWADKKLNIKLISFKDKVLPGSRESIKMVIQGPNVKDNKAELLAALYDASLDAIEKPYWPLPDFPVNFSIFRWEASRFSSQYDEALNPYWNVRDIDKENIAPAIPYLLEGINGTFSLVPFYLHYARSEMLADLPQAPLLDKVAEKKSSTMSDFAADVQPRQSIQIRANKEELVFFLPHIQSELDSTLTIEYTMNEALTSWHLMMFAHNRDLATGFAEQKIQTSKDWMVLPNLPRMVRLGDKIFITATVANNGSKNADAVVNLQLKDHLTGAKQSDWIKGESSSMLQLKAGESKVVSWEIHFSGQDAGLTEYTIWVESGKDGDGEKGVIPVISNEVLVTETMPLIVRPEEKKQLQFNPLMNLNKADQVPVRYSVEMTGHPAWYAIQALPWVIENGYENAIDFSDKFYISNVASTLLNYYPQLQSVLELWAMDTLARKSFLEANQEWKSVSLIETPWVGISNREKEQIGKLLTILNPVFLEAETERWKNQLLSLRLHDGSFGWFKGGNFNHYSTLQVAIQVGKASFLNPKAGSTDWMLPTIHFLDNLMVKTYEELRSDASPNKENLDNYQPSELFLWHLYARSFYRAVSMDESTARAYHFFANQGLKKINRYSIISQIALATYDFRNRGNTWKAIAASLLEKARKSEQSGMYWNAGNGFRWNELPVETHAAVMSFLYETGMDDGNLEEMKIWLMTHKKSHHWSSTRATADAVSALLLLRGPRQVNFTDAEGIKVEAGGSRLPLKEQTRAGSSYFIQTWSNEEINPQLGNINLGNTGYTVGLGAVYYQYRSPVEKIIPSESKSIRLNKKLYVERLQDGNKLLISVEGPTVLSPGDVLVSRLELHTDRDLEFVHIKDLRGAGLEPAQSRSGYEWSSGHSYYLHITDDANHYFLDQLSKGIHVFEARQRINLRGRYSAALATAECLYAPEFSGHSAGYMLEVR